MTRPVDEDEWPELRTMREVSWTIAQKLQLWEALCYEQQERVDRANIAAGAYFGDCLGSLLGYAIVMLAAILDKPQTGSSKNICIDTLLQQASAWLLPSELAYVRKPLQDHDSDIKALLKHRHKYLAHLDYKTWVQRDNSYTLRGGQIVGVARAVFETVNRVSMKTMNVEISYDMPPDSVIQFDSLVYDAMVLRVMRQAIAMGIDFPENIGYFIRDRMQVGIWNDWVESLGISERHPALVYQELHSRHRQMSSRPGDQATPPPRHLA